jgi:hypothetical protein
LRPFLTLQTKIVNDREALHFEFTRGPKLRRSSEGKNDAEIPPADFAESFKLCASQLAVYQHANRVADAETSPRVAVGALDVKRSCPPSSGFPMASVCVVTEPAI